jgi:hypothetical protein
MLFDVIEAIFMISLNTYCMRMLFVFDYIASATNFFRQIRRIIFYAFLTGLILPLFPPTMQKTFPPFTINTIDIYLHQRVLLFYPPLYKFSKILRSLRRIEKDQSPFLRFN